jgi:hypothetical protein
VRRNGELVRGGSARVRRACACLTHAQRLDPAPDFGFVKAAAQSLMEFLEVRGVCAACAVCAMCRPPRPPTPAQAASDEWNTRTSDEHVCAAMHRYCRFMALKAKTSEHGSNVLVPHTDIGARRRRRGVRACACVGARLCVCVCGGVLTRRGTQSWCGSRTASARRSTRRTASGCGAAKSTARCRCWRRA